MGVAPWAPAASVAWARVGVRDRLAQIGAALARYRADHPQLPRGPRVHGDQAPWLFGALCRGPRRYLEPWRRSLGVLLPEGGSRRLWSAEVKRLEEPAFLAAHRPEGPEPLVLVDPWGRPFRYELDATGRALLWSVGRDGQDDHCAASSDDRAYEPDRSEAEHADEQVFADLAPSLPRWGPADDRCAGACLLTLALLWSLALVARVVRHGAVARAGLRVRSQGAGRLRCGLCHDEDLLDAARCGGCGVLLHPECAAELGRCPTLGCTGTGADLRLGPGQRLPDRLALSLPLVREPLARRLRSPRARGRAEPSP
ncbi:MAG: hypothetical protein AB7N76_30080 [Planctomycetota bacterium]